MERNPAGAFTRTPVAAGDRQQAPVGLALLRLLWPLVGYGGLMIWLAWPAVTQARSMLLAVVGLARADTLYSAWALAWQTTALVTSPATVADANIYHPTREALFYGPTGFGALPFFAPVFLATHNAALAANFTLLGGLAVTAWMFHLVVRRWTDSDLAGFVAAATFLSNRWILGFVATTPIYAPLQFFPLIAYLAARPQETLAQALLLVPLIALECAIEPVYVAPAVVAPLAVLSGLRLLRRSTRAAGLRLAGATALALLLISPIYAGYFSVARANPDLSQQTVNPGAPETLVPVFYLWWTQLAPSGIAPVIVLLLLVVVALALFRGRGPEVAGAVPSAAWRAGLLWSLTGLLISRKPVGTIADYVVHLPQSYLIDLVPTLGRLRAPERLGVAGLTGTAILSGLAFAAVVRRFGRTRGRARLVGGVLAAIIAVGLYFDVGAMGKPPAPFLTIWTPQTPPAFLAVFRRAPGPVVEIPPGPSDSPVFPVAHASAMFRTITHGQPILNGYSSYYPADFPERMELAARLPDPAALARLRDTGVRYIWLHSSNAVGPPPEPWPQEGIAPPSNAYWLVARVGGQFLFEVAR